MPACPIEVPAPGNGSENHPQWLLEYRQKGKGMPSGAIGQTRLTRLSRSGAGIAILAGTGATIVGGTATVAGAAIMANEVASNDANPTKESGSTRIGQGDVGGAFSAFGHNLVDAVNRNTANIKDRLMSDHQATWDKFKSGEDLSDDEMVELEECVELCAAWRYYQQGESNYVEKAAEFAKNNSAWDSRELDRFSFYDASTWPSTFDRQKSDDGSAEGATRAAILSTGYFASKSGGVFSPTSMLTGAGKTTARDLIVESRYAAYGQDWKGNALYNTAYHLTYKGGTSIWKEVTGHSVEVSMANSFERASQAYSKRVELRLTSDAAKRLTGAAATRGSRALSASAKAFSGASRYVSATARAADKISTPLVIATGTIDLLQYSVQAGQSAQLSDQVKQQLDANKKQWGENYYKLKYPNGRQEWMGPTPE